MTSASRGACTPASLPASHPPVHKHATRGPPRAAPGQERTDTIRSNMETTPVQGRKRDGLRQSDPPAPKTRDLPANLDPTTRRRGAASAPPPPHTPRALGRPGRTGLPKRGRATQSQARGRRDRASPLELTETSTGPGQETRRGRNHLEWRHYQPPALEPLMVRAPHPPGGGGWARTPREHEGTHTQRARSADLNRTEPAKRTDRMEWRTRRRGERTPRRDDPPQAPRGGQGKRGGQMRDARTSTGPDPPDLPRAPPPRQ